MLITRKSTLLTCRRKVANQANELRRVLRKLDKFFVLGEQKQRILLLLSKEVKKLASKDRITKAELFENNWFFNKDQTIKLSVDSWTELTSFLKTQLLKDKPINLFKSKLNKESSDLLLQALYTLSTEENTLYHYLNKLFDVADIELRRIITYRILKKKELVDILYRFEWHIGLSLLTSLFNALDITKLENVLLEDLNKSSLQYLSELWNKPTPVFINTLEHFPRFIHYFENKCSHDVIYLVLLILIERKLSHALTKPLIQSKLINELYNYIDLFPFKTTFLIGLKTKLINIINVYARRLGIEITEVLIRFGLITVKKQRIKKHMVNVLTFNTNYFITPLRQELPSFIKLKHHIMKTSLRQNDFIKLNVRQQLHEHTFMSAEIHYMEDLLNSRSLFMLNRPFLIDFCKTLLYIKQQKGPYSDFQLHFINSFYNLNFEVFNSRLELKTKLLRYALDFKTLEKLKLPDTLTKGIAPLLLKTFLNRIYQFKIMFNEIYFSLSLLNEFYSFVFVLFCCARARVYPDASTWTYLFPLLRHFIGFADCFVQSEDMAQAISSFLTQLQTLPVNDTFYSDIETRMHKYLKLKQSYQFIHYKKHFEFNIMANSIFTMRDQFTYGVFSRDAIVSGLQMQSLLLRSRKLADAVNLTNTPNPVDFYTRFVNYIFQIFEQVTHLCDFIKQKNMTIHLLFQKLVNGIRGIEKYELTRIFELSLPQLIEELTKTPSIKLTCFTNELQTILPRLTRGWQFYKNGIQKTTLYKPHTMNAVLYNHANRKTARTKRKLFKLFNRLLSLYSFFDVYCLVQNNNMLKFVNRKLLKHNLMTHIYGSSYITKLKQMRTSLIIQAIDDNILLTSHMIYEFMLLGRYITRILIYYINTFFPEAMLFYKLVGQAINNGVFKHPVIKEWHASYTYHPFSKTSFTKKIYRKEYKLSKYTENICPLALRRGTVANFIQFVDAMVVAYFLKDLNSSVCSVYTIHDCFKSDIISGPYVIQKLLSAYQSVFKQQLLEKYFNQPEIMGEINKFKMDNNVEPLNLDDICNPQFVKY